MQVKLMYSASQKLRNNYLIQTGKRLTDNFVTVELETLTPEQRAVIVRCGIDYNERVSRPGTVIGIKPDGYNAPCFTTQGAPDLDAIPTVEAWIDMAAAALATADQYQPELDALLVQKKAEEEARQARVAELHSAYRVMQAEWLPRIDTMSEEEANQPLPADVRAVGEELRQLRATILPDIATAKSDRWKELSTMRIKAEAEAVKRAWVMAHGSDHLKRACADGYDCSRKYAIERATHEAPGFVVDIEDAAGWKDRSCPSLTALDAADAATALGLGKAIIVWLKAAPADIKTTDDYYDYEPFSPCEAIVIGNYLGKYNLVKTL